MRVHFSYSWLIASITAATAIACGSSDQPAPPASSNTGGGPSAGGAAGAAGGLVGSGGTGQSGAGGTNAAGQGGGPPTGPFCGLESCSGTKQCCAFTGRCYDPSFEGCQRQTCVVSSNDTGGGTGAGGVANCCPMGLSHCPAPSNICYHPMCVGCCP
jgi:hypothetical protein